MKLALPLKLATLATVTFSSLIPLGAAKAQTPFGQQEVPQDRFIAIAAPYGENLSNYDLLILEQVPGKRDCWSTTGSNPTVVEPLLLNFDFSGICNRSTDSNGYSVRIDGEDYGLDYTLRVVRRNGELVLVGTSLFDRSKPELVIGRTNGVTDGFLEIELDPSWRFTKRTYDGRTLGHIYLTNDQLAIQDPGDTTLPGSGGDTGGTPTTPTFGDIRGDIYRSEIEQAVARGFIAGFKEDNTFRPQAGLTREQIVSMVVEALKTVPNVNVNVPTSATSSPYPDVTSSRWSAAKIQWAKQNQIISGYPDGTFRPQQQVTRAELMAIQRRAAEYARIQQGQSPELPAQQTPQTFSDTSNHWSSNLVTQMSAYCGVASPLNETGRNFAPNTAAQRNYAAAATLRMLQCVQGESQTAAQ
ncbi:MAG: DUF3747 domain-containing protein [Halothece sp.]